MGSALNFGACQAILKSGAASGSGLAANPGFLEAVLAHVPAGEVSVVDLRSILMHPSCKFDELNLSNLGDTSWASLPAHRTITILAHLRRIAQNHVKFKQATLTCDMMDATQLRKLPSTLQLRTNAEPAPMHRKLEKQNSCDSSESLACSLDDEGFPNMLSAVNTGGGSSGCDQTCATPEPAAKKPRLPHTPELSGKGEAVWQQNLCPPSPWERSKLVRLIKDGIAVDTLEKDIGLIHKGAMANSMIQQFNIPLYLIILQHMVHQEADLEKVHFIRDSLGTDLDTHWVRCKCCILHCIQVCVCVCMCACV